MDYDPFNPLPPLERKAFDKYFNVESEFMASCGYYSFEDSIKRRKHAVRVIQHLSKSDNFDPFIPFLAMNYFDRFESRHYTPLTQKAWEDERDSLNLLAVCCLLIASKMMNNGFLVTTFQNERNLNFDPKNIMSMELQILNGLQWRTRSVTAMCFLEFFSPFFKLRDPESSQGFKLRLIRRIIQAQGAIKSTDFKPSIMAATACLSVSSEMAPYQLQELEERIQSCPFLKKKDVLKCMEVTGIKYKGKGKVIIREGGPGAEAGEESTQQEREDKPEAEQESGSGGAQKKEVMERTVEEVEEPMTNFELKWSDSGVETLGLPSPVPQQAPFSLAPRFNCCGCCLPL